jgi:hypothetical protein
MTHVESFYRDSGDSCVQLQLGSISGETYLVSMSDALTCARVLQSIQERRVSKVETISKSNESSTIEAASYSSPLSEGRDKVLVSSPSRANATSPKKPLSSEVAAKVIEAILSPSSSTKAAILARQLQHGVSELGLRMKLENEGVSEEKMDLLITKAQGLLTKLSKYDSSPSAAATKAELASTSSSIATRLGQTITESTNDRSSQSMVQAVREVSHLKKYQLMLKHGVPFTAVQTKMTSDGLSTDDQLYVKHSSSAASTSTTTSTSTSTLTSSSSYPGAPQPSYYSSSVASNTSPHSVVKDVAMEAKMSSPTTDEVVIPSHLKKFHLMMKHGVPKAAVQTKMISEGISEEDQALIMMNSAPRPVHPFIPNPRLSSSPASESSKSPLYSSKSSDLPEDLKKYQLMIKRGVPEGAVLARMKSECISKDDQTLVLSHAQSRFGLLASLGGINTEDENSNEKASKLSAAGGENSCLPEHLKKFQAMLKHGVPAAAVMTKMNMEKISSDEQQLVLQGTSNSSSSSNVEAAKFHSPQLKKASDGPRLLGLHWDPLEKTHSPNSVSENTSNLWKNLATRRSSTSALQDDELKNLVSLFARKESSAKAKSAEAETNSEASSSGDSKSTRRNSTLHSKALKVIDFSRYAQINGQRFNVQRSCLIRHMMRCRSMSISIVLTAFRSRSIDIHMVSIIELQLF